MPALPSLAAAARDSEPAGLADLARLLAGSGLSMGIVGSTAPASGSEHAVSHLLEMALSPAAGTCGTTRHAGDGRDPARAAGVAARGQLHLLWRADPDARRVFAAAGDGARPSPISARRPSRSAGRVTPPSATGCSPTRPTSRRWSPIGTGSNGRVTLPTPEQFDEVSHASGLPTRAPRTSAPDTTTRLLFWALRNSYLLRERISIVDLADLLGVWSDDTARSIVADAEKG